MAVYKNIANQKIPVFAWDTAANTEKTGDAANITARISKDGAAVAQTNDVNPTELDPTYMPGVYLFDMTQAETNADLITLFAKSGTASVKLEPVIIYTLPTWQASQVAQTGDSFASVAALNNLSAAQVWASATRTLTASLDPAAAAIVATLLATTIEGRSFEEILKDVWAQTVGDAVADNATVPTLIVYEGPDGTTQVTHTITPTTRVKS